MEADKIKSLGVCNMIQEWFGVQVDHNSCFSTHHNPGLSGTARQFELRLPELYFGWEEAKCFHPRCGGGGGLASGTLDPRLDRSRNGSAFDPQQ